MKRSMMMCKDMIILLSLLSAVALASSGSNPPNFMVFVVDGECSLSHLRTFVVARTLHQHR